MTLAQLAVSYRRQERVIRRRIQEVRALPTHSRQEELVKQDRLRTLENMLRDVRDVAMLCAHYYDPGYRRNPRYII